MIPQAFASALLSVCDCPFFSVYLIPDHARSQGGACSREEQFFRQKNHNNEPNAFEDCLRIPRLKSITLYTFEGPPCVCAAARSLGHNAAGLFSSKHVARGVGGFRLSS